MRALVLSATVLALVAGACKIDSTVYQPPADDDDDGDAGNADAAVEDTMPDAPPQTISVVVNPGTTTVSEGGQVTVRVRLSEAPPVDRPIAIIGNAQLTPTPASLTFTPSNWNVERTVILAAAQDDDADDSPVTVLFNGMGAVADGTAMVMITDDDEQVLVVSPPSSLGVTEGASGNVLVQLSARPSSNIVVSVSIMDPAVATVSTGSLTFTSGNWNMAQTVMVSGAQDANTGNETTLLVLDPSVEGIPTHTVAVNVTDDDVLAIDASPGNLGTLNEGGAGATFGVRLTQMPAADVVVTLGATPSGAVNLSQTTLTFTPANYATVQNVTANAPQDANVVDEQVTIQLSAAGLANRFVQATVDDDDTQVIELAPTSLTVNEGATSNVSVSLRFQPAGNVVIDVGSADSTIASVGTNQLTFSPTDYNQPQTVAITGVEDVDLANESTQVSFNAAAEGLTRNLPVSVTDDDMQVLNVSPTVIFVAEGGTSTYQVSLSYQPATSVTVMNVVPASSSTDISAAPGTLTFTPANYATPQTVTVTGLQDSDVTNEMATVTVQSSGVPSVNVTANVSDDDSLGIVASPSTMTINEGAQAGTLMVSLAAMPATNVTVNVATNPTGVVTALPTSLVFTPADYATPQSVTVTAIDDPDSADGSTTIYLTASGLDEKTVPVTVIDDDVVAPVITPNPHSIVEGEWDGAAALTLSRDPNRVITVDVASFGFTDFEVQPTQYVFERGQWDAPQKINLLAYSDDETDDETEDVLFTIQSEGTQTNLRVNIDDRTILLGFPPPFGSNTAGFTGLEAWRDGQMPQCFLVEKIALDVGAAPGQFPAMQVGLYATSQADSQPYDLLYSSGYIGLGPTAGVQIIDVQDTTIQNLAGAVTTWVAVEATTGVTLKTKPSLGQHCVRQHNFGDFLPDPFNSSGSGSMTGGGDLFDAGTDAGTVNVSCNQTPPVAVWIIGRDASCVNPAKPSAGSGGSGPFGVSALFEGLIDTSRR